MALLPTEFLQAGAYSAKRLRGAVMRGALEGEGVTESGAFVVTQRAAGANMSVDVAAGSAQVRGDSSDDQGLYRQVNDATVNLPLAASHATLPRVDRVILRINDAEAAGATNTPTLEVLTGTPTSGATLDNLLGVQALPISAMLLADVLVAAGVTSVSTGTNIRPRLSVAGLGISPQTYTGSAYYGEAFFAPLPIYYTLQENSGYSAPNAWGGPAVLHSPIREATKLRIPLKNPSAISGTFNVAIYTAGGIKVTETGAVNFAGSTSTWLDYVVTIPALTLDAGLYFVVVVFTGGNNTAQPSLYQYGSANHSLLQLNNMNPTSGTSLPSVLPVGSKPGASLPAVYLRNRY